MQLNSENYFSPEAMHEYMSVSQFKAFDRCQAAAMAELTGEWTPEPKEAFNEGKMFEALICGEEEIFFMEHPEVISSQGKTKGNVKANYLNIMNAAEAFKRQKEFAKIVAHSQKQVIVTGIICGVKYKGCIDFYNPETGDCWDSKCMKDFKGVYSAEEGRMLHWWEVYGYHWQAAIYRELCRQTFGKAGRFGLVAATKEPVPDVAWLEFENGFLDNALDIIIELSPVYQAIKDGLIDPEACGKCAYCKTHKQLCKPEKIGEYMEEENKNA